MRRRFILEAKRAKTKYKSTSRWLDAVYRNNKELIDSKIEEPAGRTSKKEVFKQLVKEYQDEGYTAKTALKKVSRSTIFTTSKERLQANAYEGIIDDKEAYRSFREMTKVHGKYQKVEYDKFVYDKDSHSYIYDNKIRISFENSPKEIIVEEYDPEDDDYE